MSTSAADQSSQEEKDPQFAYTLARGLDVLRAFDASSPVLGNRELSQRTGISRPTVARLTREGRQTVCAAAGIAADALARAAP